MATEVELGAHPLGEPAADRPSGNARSVDPSARDAIPMDRSGSPRNDRGLWQQFLENLMPALGAWHV